MNKREKATILVIDDMPGNILALENLLSEPGRAIVSAKTGKEGLMRALNHDVDLIILDVHMPDMDGFEVAHVLKSNNKTRDIPIIFASAESKEHSSMIKGFGEGAFDYLLKPLDPEITRAKVSVFLKLQLQKKELLEKNALLERDALLISNSADIIGILDASTLKVEMINPAFTDILGYPAADVIGKSLGYFLSEADIQAMQKLATGEGGKVSFELKVLTVERKVRWLNWNVTAQNKKLFVNARDVTEIKLLNNNLQRTVAQLEASNNELEAFSYSISHDLRAPLRALNGNSRAIEEDFGDQLPEGARQYLKKIYNGVRRMDGLINDLLAFSKVSKKQLRKGLVNVDEMVRSIVEEMALSTRAKAVVTIGTLPDTYGDYAMLQQVWVNLISNALKYSSKKDAPQVTIDAVSGDEFTEYTIRDNGVGFDMAYASRLFGTFQRLHDASEFEGTGIGLAIVQRIILRHGGTIRAEAVPNEGAAFIFRLPNGD